MSEVTTNQPNGTPTWIDLGIPDLDRAMEFYRALFGWEFDVGPAETGHYAMCLLDGKPVAAIMPNPDSSATDFWWNVYLATDDCDGGAGTRSPRSRRRAVRRPGPVAARSSASAGWQASPPSRCRPRRTA